MAFKPIALSSSATYISHADPAIDREAIIEELVATDPELQRISDPAKRADEAWGKFLGKFTEAVIKDPSSSRKLLKFKAGETATEFVLGVIPSDEQTRIADETAPDKDDPNGRSGERYWRAFLVGLRDISGWPEAPKKRRVGDVEYVDPQWLKANFVRGLRHIGIEAGMVCWFWNQFTEAEAKN